MYFLGVWATSMKWLLLFLFVLQGRHTLVMFRVTSGSALRSLMEELGTTSGLATGKVRAQSIVLLLRDNMTFYTYTPYYNQWALSQKECERWCIWKEWQAKLFFLIQEFGKILKVTEIWHYIWKILNILTKQASENNRFV